MKGAVSKGEEALKGYTRRGVHMLHDKAMRAAGNSGPLQSGIAALGNTTIDVLYKKKLGSRIKTLWHPCSLNLPVITL